jgi:6-pyruvoyltetrahydropterin/6-carboxytetrahydropterin synthase
MFEIRKQFTFSAAHQLDHLPKDHPCSRIHGHNYIVEIVLQAETLNGDGFVIDYGDLAPLQRHIDQLFDHRCLNEWFPSYPTAENIAQYLFAWCHAAWPQTAAVRVSETPRTWAEYWQSPQPIVLRALPDLQLRDEPDDPAESIMSSLMKGIRNWGV